MSSQTLFNGVSVVVDTMVIINFHGLLALDRLINWAKGELVVEKHVKNEARFSMNGPINLEPYLQQKLIIEESIEGKEQEDLFYFYISNKLTGTIIHAAEAACLALAISKGYGLACDEKAVRNEFKKKCPNQICVHSWGIVDRANKLGFIGDQEADDLKKGFYFL